MILKITWNQRRIEFRSYFGSNISSLLSIKVHLALNSPGTIVCSTDNFPFWAKILTDFSSTSYHFWKLISYSNSGQLVLVLWNVIRIWISVITWENSAKQKAKYEKGKSSVPGELTSFEFQWDSKSYENIETWVNDKWSEISQTKVHQIQLQKILSL